MWKNNRSNTWIVIVIEKKTTAMYFTLAPEKLSCKRVIKGPNISLGAVSPRAQHSAISAFVNRVNHLKSIPSCSDLSSVQERGGTLFLANQM